MRVLSIILIVSGIICFLIAALRPTFIMQSKKFQLMEKYLGKLGTILLVLGFGLTALVAGIIIYE